MALKVKRDVNARIQIELTVGASKLKDTVEVIQEMPVYLLEDSDSNNKALCSLPSSLSVLLNVKGETTVNAAVAIGDKIYKDGSTYNRDATNGVLFGYALGAVSSGATTEIEVALIG